MTRVVVAGAGSIGSLLAAHLARVADVTVLTRREEHAATLREEMIGLTEAWRKRGYELDFGAGIALGYATCGEVGFEGRSDYAAIGSVTNLASRLADEAAGGQVLITQRLYAEVETQVETVPAGEFSLKGFGRPVPAFDVIAVRQPAELTSS